VTDSSSYPSLRAPKGVPDYLPPDSAQFVAVRDGLLEAARRAGYGYVELPIFEDTALFARGVGESTDVVSKEMYTFADRGERSVTLRPEGTAGVMRAVIEHGVDRGPLPAKLCYSGPLAKPSLDGNTARRKPLRPAPGSCLTLMSSVCAGPTWTLRRYLARPAPVPDNMAGYGMQVVPAFESKRHTSSAGSNS